MAKETFVRLVDDLDGSEIEEGAGETVSFGFRGIEYEIDLKDANVSKLDKAMEKWVEHATRVGGRKRTRVSPGATGSSPDQLRVIREWAKSEGYDIADRGRIPESILSAFVEAH